MQEAKVQYTVDGKSWMDLENGKIYSMPTKITIENLDIEAMGIRVIATKAKSNTWFGVKDIIVNKGNVVEDTTVLNLTLIRSQWQQIYQGTEANLFDGNDTTDVWYKTHTGDMTNVGDFIGVDLGQIIPVGNVRFVVGRNGSGDKWTSYKLEYSKDNTNWTTFKEYTGKANGQDIIEENLEGKEARYVRLTNKVSLNKWVIFSEINVKKYNTNASIKNIYTNTKLELSSSSESEALTKLAAKENITLHANEYIGIKLDRIKDLSKIDVKVSNADGLKLQTSTNEIEWKDVDLESPNNLEDSRYIRLISNKDVTFNLTKFEVSSNEVSAPSLKDSFVAITGNVNNIFDKNFNTLASFNSTPVKDKSILFDLGQTISVKNLTYAVLDTELDYLRDAKFQISLDGKEWSDVITIGDGVENNNSDANSKPVEAGYKHGDSTTIVPVSHSFVKGELDSAKEARYLRILFTANYSSRWIKISEILINDGAYIKTINDPTYSSNPIELEGFAPQNIKDGNLTTAYKPNTNNGEIKSGSITYTLSENTDVKKINIVQNGNEISNAKVMVRTGYNEAGEGIWKELGILNKSLTELVNVKGGNIFEIRIDWAGIAPTIYEIVTINDYNLPNITDLEELVSDSKEYNSENYTKSSFNKFSEALEKAKDVLNNLAKVSQKEIDTAKESLVSSITGLVDISFLKAAVDNGNNYLNNGVEYSEDSLDSLRGNIQFASLILSNSDTTKEMVAKAVENINKAINELIVKDNTDSQNPGGSTENPGDGNGVSGSGSVNEETGSSNENGSNVGSDNNANLDNKNGKEINKDNSISIKGNTSVEDNSSKNNSSSLPKTGGTSSLILLGIAVTLVSAGSLIRKKYKF